MIFSQLKQFSLDGERIKQSLLFRKESSALATPAEPVAPVNTMVKSVESLFVPKYIDSLFWCFYILKNDFEKYNFIKSPFSTEKEIKISFIELMRENKTLLKQMKMRRSIFENNLLNDEKITVETFLVFCVFYKINIIVKDNIKYLEIIHDDGPVNIIETSMNKYGINYTSKFCKDKYWKIQGYNFNNPIRPISNYKLKDLRDICKILDIDITKKKKKDLYEQIKIELDIKKR